MTIQIKILATKMITNAHISNKTNKNKTIETIINNNNNHKTNTHKNNHKIYNVMIKQSNQFFIHADIKQNKTNDFDKNKEKEL